MRHQGSEQEIMANWKGDPSQPLVSICCITYNHEAYIEDTLEGFLIQETDFPFEILIHDDASTDKTADIIREYEAAYPTLIKPIYQTENQYSQGKRPNPQFNFPRTKGKYIALCEGDDYWTDPLKLQRQVDFMKANPNCTGCFHACTIDYQNSRRTKVVRYHGPKKFDLKYYLKKNIFIATASLLFKSNISMEIPRWTENLFAGDFVLRYFILLYGNFGFIRENMCTYRKGVPNSWSKQKISYKKIDEEYKDNILALTEINKILNYKYSFEIMLKSRRLYSYYVSRYINIADLKAGIYLYFNNISVFGSKKYKILIKFLYHHLKK